MIIRKKLGIMVVMLIIIFSAIAFVSTFQRQSFDAYYKENPADHGTVIAIDNTDDKTLVFSESALNTHSGIYVTYYRNSKFGWEKVCTFGGVQVDESGVPFSVFDFGDLYLAYGIYTTKDTIQVKLDGDLSKNIPFKTNSINKEHNLWYSFLDRNTYEKIANNRIHIVVERAGE